MKNNKKKTRGKKKRKEIKKKKPLPKKKNKEKNEELLIFYGKINKGLHEILGNKIYNIPNSKILNFFPKQKTETVRLEEAIGGVLSILNIFN